MPRKVVIYKKYVDEHNPGRIIRVPLRNIQVHDSFIGISKFGKPIMSEMLALAHDLELGERDLHVEVLQL